MSRWSGAITLERVTSRFRDPDPLVRLGVVRAVAALCRDKPELHRKALAVLARHLRRKCPRDIDYGDYISENLADIEIREFQWRYARYAPAMEILIERTRSRNFPLRQAAVDSLASLCNRASAPRILRLFRRRLRSERHHGMRATLRAEIAKLEEKLNF